MISARTQRRYYASKPYWAKYRVNESLVSVSVIQIYFVYITLVPVRNKEKINKNSL